MTSNGFVGNTDQRWFKHLSTRPDLDEVNFWKPGGGNFRAIEPGAPFFFRLKAPHRAIGGFGFFLSFTRMRIRDAWDVFGERNGAPDWPTFRDRVTGYRSGPQDPHGRAEIGCILVTSPVFFPRERWVREPDGWARNIVAGKRVDVDAGDGLRLFQDCMRHRLEIAACTPDLLELGESIRRGTPHLVQPRLGQGTFRLAVEEAYQRACAVTIEHSRPVLEAAHITPFAAGGPHEVSNGLLLRTDIHRLFDQGYVTVTPSMHFEVSPRLRDEFHNGKTYYALHGGRIAVPQRVADRPDPERLRWHNEVVFQAG